MAESYKKHLETLMNPDIDIYVKKKSAEFFLAQAEKGASITDAVPGLEELYFESHQVPCMEPAADALITHYLNRDEIKKIDTFISDDELKLFSLASAGRVALSRGIKKLLPVIINYFHDENYVVFNVVRDYIKAHKKKGPEILKFLAEIMEKNKKAHPFVPFVIQEGAIEKLDMAPLLPAVLPILTSREKKERENAASSLRWAVESNTNFSQIIPQMENILETESDILGEISYCLAYHYIKMKQHKKIIPLISRSNSTIRQKSFRAIAVRYNNDSKNDKKLLPLLLQGFSDISDDIRKYTAKAVLEIQRNNITIVPEGKNLSGFIETLKGPGDNDESYQYLYNIASKDKKVEKAVLKIISQPEYAESTAASLLKDCFHSLDEGEISPVCSICSNISPKGKWYTHESDLPKEAAALNLPMPSLDEIVSHPVCPECGNLYYYKFTQEYEDMSLDTSIVLRRLDIEETRYYLKGEEQTRFIENIPSLISTLKNDLSHPVKYKREEAAWKLSRYALAHSDWDLLEVLVRNPEKGIRQEALYEIKQLGADGIPFRQFVESLEKGTADPDVVIRRDSAALLIDKAVKDKKYEDIHWLLENTDPEVLAAVIQGIYTGIRGGNFSIDSLLRRLKEFSRFPDKKVRRYALSCIKEGAESAGYSSVEIIKENLSHYDMEIRGDALFTLGEMAKDGNDISAAIPQVAKQLENKETAWKANDVLSNAAYWAKADISPALEAVLREIQNPDCSIRGDLVFTLTRGMRESGLDVSPGYEILGALLNEKDQNLRIAPIELFEEAMRRGDTISIIEPFLKNYLKQRRLTDYYGEFVVKALTYIYLKQKDWKSLNKLLARKNKHIPGPAASFLTETLKKGFVDISEILPVLVDNMTKDYWYIRDMAERALEEFAAHNAEAGNEVCRSLEKYGELNEQQQKLLKKIGGVKAKTADGAGGKKAARSLGEQAFNRLVNKEVYLTNLQKAQQIRGTDEPRYIFYAGTRLYDLWYDRKKKKITDLSWCEKDEIPHILEIAFTPGGIEGFFKPYKEVPEKVIEEALYRGDKVYGVLEAIKNSGIWFPMGTSKYTEGDRFYMQWEKGRGYYLIITDEMGRITDINPNSRGRAEKNVDDFLLESPDALISDEITEIAEKAASFWNTAEETLAAMDRGQILIDYEDDYHRRYYIKSGDSFFYIFADGGTLDTVSERKEEAVLEEVFRKITGKGEVPEFAALEAPLLKAISAQTDSEEYISQIRKGELTIGGGYTTDTQWRIFYKKGSFYRSISDGYGGSNETSMSENEVREIIKKKQYGWVRKN